ncbi:sugar phosphate isomerase/epimerase family protein [Bryobacter aggregatus]|uniref:sugar phosphate isomerase/epimerase family protein n=1 Tax=Bryobacter aggregatus TaxID=360054 RepID=UPI0004E2867C|nr:sugar phosphate isomerase/epimerase family protein [Bryobacter aggregatus]
MKFRHAICNEAFEKWDFREACRTMKQLGYEGIEIAPFTLAEKPLDVSPAQRREFKQIMADEGLTFVGLHWIMVSPAGLQVTTPDNALRAKSWQHIRDLVDLCADLGPDGVMVFGSPKQRGTTGGLSVAEATKNYVDGMAGVAPHAEARGVKILIEALPVEQCDVVTTLDEAVAHVKTIGSPAVWTMFDTHNAVNEVEPHADLIEKHYSFIRHIHVNETDGRHPGTADYDFVPVFQRLAKLNYGGWISMEAFDFSPGADVLAKESIDYLNLKIREAGAA